MEEVEIRNDFVIEICEFSDGEIICLNTNFEDEYKQILMTRENAINVALLILDLAGYEKE